MRRRLASLAQRAAIEAGVVALVVVLMCSGVAAKLRGHAS